jgi:hypothetical protein
VGVTALVRGATARAAFRGPSPQSRDCFSLDCLPLRWFLSCGYHPGYPMRIVVYSTGRP